MVSFKCEISGNPVPTGTWYKGKKELKDEGRVLIEIEEDFSELEIENVETSDEGEYICLVKNDFGEDKCTVTLTVKGGNGVLSRNQILLVEITNKTVTCFMIRARWNHQHKERVFRSNFPYHLS